MYKNTGHKIKKEIEAREQEAYKLEFIKKSKCCIMCGFKIVRPSKIKNVCLNCYKLNNIGANDDNA